jgi:hypothetical protein
MEIYCQRATAEAYIFRPPEVLSRGSFIHGLLAHGLHRCTLRPNEQPRQSQPWMLRLPFICIACNPMWIRVRDCLFPRLTDMEKWKKAGKHVAIAMSRLLRWPSSNSSQLSYTM